MRYMRLGKTGLMVSRVGLGGIPLTRPEFDDAAALVRYALDRGINFIDTAFGYSDSEDRIGKGIEGRRGEVILATKTPAIKKPDALQHLDTSLRRLGTDYLDIWQLHGVSSEEGLREQVLADDSAYQAALDARAAGKVRHIGVSSHNVDVAVKLVETGLFEVIQFPFNFISDEATERLVGLCKEMDVGFIGMKPFAGGMIRDAGLTFRWILQYDNVLPDPGVEKPEEVDEIVAIVESGKKIDDADWTRIGELRAKHGKRFCRQCGYCMPGCPQNVIIPGMLYLQRLYELWPPERFFSWRLVTASVERAETCVKCGACEPKCPYGLPIREMIDENLVFYRRVLAEWEARASNTGQ